MREETWDPTVTGWIHFRNSHNLGPVVVQSFMMLCALLVVIGLVYVLLLVIAIAFHHILFDRDAKKVPNYVKRSVQFSSESENDDDGEGEESDSESDDNDLNSSGYGQTARKLAKLEKFMNYDDKK